jgi:bacillolysin
LKKQIVTLGLAAGLLAGPILAPSSFSASSENANINWSDSVKTPEFVSGKLTKPSKRSAEDIVFTYLNEQKELFKFNADAKSAFVVKEMKKDKLGYTYLRMQQMYKGTPVFGAMITAHVNKDGVLTAVSGTVLPELEKKSQLKQASKLNRNDAVAIGQADLASTLEGEIQYEVAPKASLVVYVEGETAQYAYHVNYNFLHPEPGNWAYFIDAKTGDVLAKYNEIHTGNGKGGKPGGGGTEPGTDTLGTGTGVLGNQVTLNTYLSSSTYYLQDNTRGNGIFTYDAKNRTRLPGSLWGDSDNVMNASYDAAAVDAHYFAGVTYDYYANVFNRNSYDDAGAPLKATVHYSRDYNNAFWNGQQMVYGDGDGVTFVELSGGLDVVAHELTHAVTDSTADLIYQDESGAINEAMSDIFGTLVEYYNGNSPDWLIGEDIYTPGTSGDALRSMADPTAQGDPDHYSVRYTGTGDNGGVHINSGIVNKAAYLLSEGGTHYGVTVSGIGKDKMGEVFYRSLTQYLTPSSTMSQLRTAAVQSATDLYGSASVEVEEVNAAFDAVGIQ